MKNVYIFFLRFAPNAMSTHSHTIQFSLTAFAPFAVFRFCFIHNFLSFFCTFALVSVNFAITLHPSDGLMNQWEHKLNKNPFTARIKAKFRFEQIPFLHRSALIENCECRASRKINKILLEHRIADGYCKCVCECDSVCCVCVASAMRVSEHFLDIRCVSTTNTIREPVDENNHRVEWKWQHIKAFLPTKHYTLASDNNISTTTSEGSLRACVILLLPKSRTTIDDNMTESKNHIRACAPFVLSRLAWAQRHTHTRTQPERQRRVVYSCARRTPKCTEKCQTIVV